MNSHSCYLLTGMEPRCEEFVRIIRSVNIKVQHSFHAAFVALICLLFFFFLNTYPEFIAVN